MVQRNGGCDLAEIQEPSDITYRIFDYNRPGLDGKPRQLHTEQAKDVIDYKVYPSYKTDYERKENAGVQVAKCQYFTTDVYELSKGVSVDLSGLAAVKKNFYVVMCLEGSGSVLGTDGTRTPVKAGEAILAMGEKQISFEPESPKLKLLTIGIIRPIWTAFRCSEIICSPQKKASFRMSMMLWYMCMRSKPKIFRIIPLLSTIMS